NHLIGDEQDVVFGEDLFDLRPVGVRRNDHTARALDRLGDERADVVFANFENFLFQLFGRPDAERVRGHVTAFTKPVRLRDVDDARDRQVALFMHVRHAAQTRARHGGAVVAVDAADDDLLVRLALDRPVVTDHAQYGVVAFGTGTGEKHMIHAFRGDVGNRLGQVQCRRVSGLEEQVVIRQFAHLLAGGIGQLV
nr:hypothetical protein [Tanacetum cinerariifolium]